MTLARLGVVGDIHAEDARLAAALAVFREQRVEQVLFVGDVVDGEGDVDRCCALLAEAGALGVRGNHDRWLLEDRMRTLPDAHRRAELAPSSIALLEALPVTREIETRAGSLLLCHGVGESDMLRLSPHDDGYALESNDELRRLIQQRRHRIVVGGHTHVRMVRRYGAGELRLEGDGSLVFVNAGALARSERPCCVVLDLGAPRARFFELGEPGAPVEAEVVALPL